MIERRKRGVEATEVIENGAGTINIEGRPELLGGPGKIDILAVKFSVAIAERMHSTL
jgi:hypothetical protein